ncbi:MAG: xanthine dehydrogenase family protein molybdopterin-binding subunit [Deltaproteobacteria bacterium]|nr:MAG: xanthine dehydrogenase family protein molybdopterin-binding subunit [Deltaproteobacteria bacterium]
MSDLQVMGKSYPQIDAMEKAMGKTTFVSDLVLPNMLYGRILRSPFPHAKILNINTAKARALPGVKAVVTYNDTPGIPFGPRTEDWTIFAKDKVRFFGDEVAAVAAIDEDTAEEALDLIQVEYEELPFVTDPVEALKPGAPLVHEDRPNNIAAEFRIEAGDVDEALSKSDFVYEDRYQTNQVYQAYLEPMGGIADVDISGRVTLWAGTQIPNMSRMTYAKALGLAPDDIRIIVPDYGGGFGGKFETNVHLIAIVLAQKTGRPVRVFNTRYDDFIAGNPRVPMYIDIKIGATEEGLLTGKEVKVIGAAGARVVYAQAIVSTACYRVDSLYRFKNVRATGYTVYTNTVPTGCFRGFGNAQMTFVLESALDTIAEALSIDPAELRKKNAIGPNETSVHGWEIKSCALRECISKATEAANWAEKRKKRKKFKGIGIACCNHVSGNRPFAREFDGGSGIVRIGRDGRVLVFHGESDMGQGQKTAFAQIVAERLGVPLEMVHVAQVDTDISPFGCGSFASRGTVMGGHGVLAAAEDAFRQLAEIVAAKLEANPDDVVCRDGKFFIKGSPDTAIPFKDVADQAATLRHGAPIVGVGFYDPPTVLPDPETKYGNISPVYPFACHIAEVEVDPDNGVVEVTNYVAAHDSGKVVNPMAIEGQIDGGVLQGMGWALMENMVVKDGRLVNPDFLDYLVPTAMDAPRVNKILVEPIDPNGPYGAKGIGEPALNPVTAAIGNAIYDATGIRMKELPITPEKILARLKEGRKE